MNHSRQSKLPKWNLTTSSWGGSSLSIGEKFFALCIPCLGLFEAIFWSLANCCNQENHQPYVTFDDLVRLASTSPFSVNEVEALHDMFMKLSNSIIKDGLIHKEELQLALFHSTVDRNLFLERVFDLFDEKKNGVIEFEEFIHALGVFHPSASLEDKIDFAFRLYDLRQTGYIERDEVRQMVVSSLLEADMQISDHSLKAIIDKTFIDADTDRDGKISKEEWRTYVCRHPALLKNMTLPYLRDVTTLFPSFIFKTGVDD